MPLTLAAPTPQPRPHGCHLGHAHGRTAVWICEYPYPTMRQEGPSSDCAGCPVWAELERSRYEAAIEAAEEVRELEVMFR